MASVAMSAAVTGAQAQQLRIDTISNNVANVNTDGYKRMEATFSDLFYVNLKRSGILENSEAAPRPVGVQTGMGTRIIGTFRNMEPGALRQTFHPLDIAITGNGYFEIQLPNGRIAIPANIPTETVQIAENCQITAQNPANPAETITTETTIISLNNTPNV